jgi:hypothetical protein
MRIPAPWVLVLQRAQGKHPHCGRCSQGRHGKRLQRLKLADGLRFLCCNICFLPKLMYLTQCSHHPSRTNLSKQVLSEPHCKATPMHPHIFHSGRCTTAPQGLARSGGRWQALRPAPCLTNNQHRGPHDGWCPDGRGPLRCMRIYELCVELWQKTGWITRCGARLLRGPPRTGTCGHAPAD